MPATHDGQFRPLLGGIGVYNPQSGAGMGTLSVVLTDDQGARFVLSCYHVLCRKGAQAAPPPETIYQPLDPFGIARSVPGMSDSGLDSALAKINADVGFLRRSILGIGLLGDPVVPVVGMAVIKSGYETGVTEGVITQVSTDKVEVGVPSGFSSNYILNAAGDSGAVWVTKDGAQPVAMHTGGIGSNSRISKATRMDRIMMRHQLWL